jgi:glycerol-3-phosphate cytidylyltransferase-like family protein
MIIETAQLSDYGGQVAMVDGCFDPMHDGHIAYFRGAAEFGIPVLCNVASDSWTVTKHQVLLSQAQRGVVIDAIRYISFVHLSSISTLEVLKLLRPRFYIKGNDWVARGGVPQEEQDACNSLNIEVKYLDTVTNSSTRLLSDWSAQ